MKLRTSFLEEEVRSGFLVTKKRKKIWAVELQLLERFDEVCKKHGITYYAYYGTLLGAVRHHGFIPWDDDIDVAMLRDDYERFQAVAPDEFTEPYFFQNSYTDQIIWTISKIRDNRTTAIEQPFNYLKDFHQGIFIDIFPLDSVSDGINKQFTVIENIQRLLLRTIAEPEKVLAEIEAGKKFELDMEFLLDILKKDPRWKFRLLEDFCTSHFGETQDVDALMENLNSEKNRQVKKEWFREIIYLPFENLFLPVPKEYDKILTKCYGDYHKWIQGSSEHEGIVFEPDIPYIKYLQYQQSV